MNTIQISNIIQIVKEAAGYFQDRKAAGEITEKGIADFVTNTDKNVQSFIQSALAEQYPQIQFMGEEKNNQDIDMSKPVWILDPVDGTTNLIHAYKASCISLALMEQGEIQLGIVYHPYFDEVFHAIKGQGAYCNGERLQVSGAETLQDSLIAIGTSPYYKDLAEENFELFKRIFLECQDIRRMGSAALDLAWTASGRCEAYLERNLKLWDYAAGMLLVREAGGEVLDYAGKKAEPKYMSDILAGNGKIEKIIAGTFF